MSTGTQFMGPQGRVNDAMQMLNERQHRRTHSYLAHTHPPGMSSFLQLALKSFSTSADESHLQTRGAAPVR